MAILHKKIYGFNTNLIKSQLAFCPLRNWQTDSKMNIEMQGSQKNPKTILKTKNKANGPNFTTYYKATVISTILYCFKDKHIINGIGLRIKISHYNYGQIIFHKGDKTVKWWKNSLFQQILMKQLNHMHRMNLEPCLTPCIRNYLKMYQRRKCRS